MLARLCVLVILVLATPCVAAPAVNELAPKQPVEAEVLCNDGSRLKVSLLDEKLTLTTKYGDLQIPFESVKKIEFATRTPADLQTHIESAIQSLGSADFETREKASAALKKVGVRGYATILKACKSDNAEVSDRATMVVQHIRTQMGNDFVTRVEDAVYVDDCKMTGRIKVDSFKVTTSLFGEQILKLSEVNSLSIGDGLVSDEEVNAEDAPKNLMAHQNQIGKVCVYKITGAIADSGSNVWGTDTYTLDSNLGMAAVHAGLLKPGEKKVFKIRIIQSPPQFISSFRNGVNSTHYGTYPSGAFEFVK